MLTFFCRWNLLKNYHSTVIDCLKGKSFKPRETRQNLPDVLFRHKTDLLLIFICLLHGFSQEQLGPNWPEILRIIEEQAQADVEYWENFYGRKMTETCNFT